MASGGTGAATFSSGVLYGNGTSALISTSSPTVGWLTATSSIATSTFSGHVIFEGNVAPRIGSTTYANPITIDWATGATQRIILEGNTNIIINSTSSHPLDGGRYILKACQDTTGSRTATFVTPALRWDTTLGTSSVNATANVCTSFGLFYDGRSTLYSVLATSSVLDK